MPKLMFDPVLIMRMHLHVREAQSLGQNKGARVEGIQRWALGAPGDSWCCELAIGKALDMAFQGQSPFTRSTEVNASTVEALKFATAQNWVVPLSQAVPGDLVFHVHPDGTPHHVGILVEVVSVADRQIITIAGNTSEDGVSSNGDRVAERQMSADGKVFVQYPREWTS